MEKWNKNREDGQAAENTSSVCKSIAISPFTSNVSHITHHHFMFRLSCILWCSFWCSPSRFRSWLKTVLQIWMSKPSSGRLINFIVAKAVMLKWRCRSERPTGSELWPWNYGQNLHCYHIIKERKGRRYVTHQD